MMVHYIYIGGYNSWTVYQMLSYNSQPYGLFNAFILEDLEKTSVKCTAIHDFYQI